MQPFSSLTRYCLLFIMLSYSYTNSFGQDHTFKGFYISLQGDTVQGSFPRYKQWNYNPVKVMFVSSQTGNLLTLTPFTCREFHINNYDTYISFRGKRMTNPIEFTKAENSPDAETYDTITCFLRQITEDAQYKFYILKDDLRWNLYYSTKNQDITELLQKAAISNNTFRLSMTYKEQMKKLFPDDIRGANGLLYNEESLKAFINKRKKATGTFKKTKDTDRGLVITGGISISSLKFRPTRLLDFSEKTYSSSTAPLLTVGYIVPFSRNFSRGFFFPQMRLSSFEHTATTYHESSYAVVSNTFRSSPVISMAFHLGYNIVNRPNLKVSIATGAGLDFLVKNKQIDDLRYSPTIFQSVVTEMNHMTYLCDVQANIIVKKKYMLAWAYNLPAPVTSYAVTSGRRSSLQLSAGYKF